MAEETRQARAARPTTYENLSWGCSWRAPSSLVRAPAASRRFRTLRGRQHRSPLPAATVTLGPSHVPSPGNLGAATAVAVLQCCSAVTLRTEGSRAGASVGGRSGRAGPGCLQAGEDDDNGGVDDERHRVALGGVDEDEDVSEEDETDEQQQVREVVVAEGHLEVLDLRPPARGRAGADTSRHRFICILSYFL